MGIATFGRKLQKYFFSSDSNSDSNSNNGGAPNPCPSTTPNNVNNGGAPNLYVSNPPKDVLEIPVAGDWPSWLSTVAAEAINGWSPRKADTFDKLEKIGQGRSSNVYKARDRLTGNLVALKKLTFDTSNPEIVKMMAMEIVILRRLDHPNVIKLQGIATSRMVYSLYLVFDYMEHNFAALVANPDIQFAEPWVMHYMYQLISGLKHCHDHEVLHRDITLSDLLLDDNGVLKIADFGSASFFNLIHKQPLTTRVATFWYRAPELLLGATEYGVGVDLWSAGCILAELLAKRPILDGHTEAEQLQKIYALCGPPPDRFWKMNKLPKKISYKPDKQCKRCITETFKDFPPSSLSLLDTLLSINPAERQSAASALNSEFFTASHDACDPSTLPILCHSEPSTLPIKRRHVLRRRRSSIPD